MDTFLATLTRCERHRCVSASRCMLARWRGSRRACSGFAPPCWDAVHDGQVHWSPAAPFVREKLVTEFKRFKHTGHDQGPRRPRSVSTDPSIPKGVFCYQGEKRHFVLQSNVWLFQNVKGREDKTLQTDKWETVGSL